MCFLGFAWIQKVAAIPFKCKGEACLVSMSVISQAAMPVLVVSSCEYRVHVGILFVHVSFLILFCIIHQVTGLFSIVSLLQGSCNFRKPYLKVLFMPWSITYQAYVGCSFPCSIPVAYYVGLSTMLICEKIQKHVLSLRVGVGIHSQDPHNAQAL